jgi:hypothetical protein
MGSCKPLLRYTKVVIVFERREDGGLRVYSDDLPGLVLSHSNPDAVLADVKPAIEGIMSAMYHANVTAEIIGDTRVELERAGVIDPRAETLPHVERSSQAYLALIN